MLGNYENRRFEDGVKVWIGRYKNLVNVLHWHFECEIIHVISGNARIKIADKCFEASSGDSFFCAGEELHYIISENDAKIDIMIIKEDLLKDITAKYTLSSPKLPDFINTEIHLRHIRELFREKGRFYRESLENYVRYFAIEIFRKCDISDKTASEKSYKKLLSYINDNFSYISFSDAVKHSGYSPAHFSRVFKELTGMTFSKYINIIRIENALALIRSDKKISITAISQQCGFSTVRNFNRVFKKITGMSPRLVPDSFILDGGLLVQSNRRFDPTDINSELI